MLELDPPPDKHERLYIYRRRARLKIHQLARMLAISNTQYMRWERGEAWENCPDIDVGELSQMEVCILLRRRAGLTIHQLAERWGKSHSAVDRMEHELIRTDDLIEYWRKTLSEQ